MQIEVIDQDGQTAIIAIDTPVGRLELLGAITLRGGRLSITNAHAQGLSRGALGRAGLNAIARKLLEESGARELVIEGATRTTGVPPGRKPRPYRFPR